MYAIRSYYDILLEALKSRPFRLLRVNQLQGLKQPVDDILPGTWIEIIQGQYRLLGFLAFLFRQFQVRYHRITSYNVCYTKLLRRQKKGREAPF